MRFNLRRKPDDRPDHGNGTEDSGVDLDRWVELGADAQSAVPGSPSDQRSATDVDCSDESTIDGDQRPLSLRDKLLAVLAEDDASLVPPSAGDMTQAEWDSLSEIEREGYRRKQLDQLDPRIVPRYTMGTSLSGSRSARVYR